MRVHVTDLKPGDRLVSDTFNNHGLHVLNQGAVLNMSDISKLLQHGIDYVDIIPYVEDPKVTEFKNKALELARPTLTNAVDGFESLFHEAITTGKINETMVDDIVEPMVEQLTTYKDVVSLLISVEEQDDYTYHHSMQVGMLSYYMASWLGYSKEEALLASKAGYLHDIGKCMISRDILNKPGKLTAEEFNEMKKHTLYGYEIIKDSIQDEVAALVALQHHERDDGSGYPYQLKEHEVHPFSQITAVADVFSAMTTNRVYQSRQELLVVLREIYSLSFGKLNGKPTQVFIQHMLPNFIGKKVSLSSGETGIIVMTNPTDYFRPLVKIGERFSDLAIERHITIEHVYM